MKTIVRFSFFTLLTLLAISCSSQRNLSANMTGRVAIHDTIPVEDTVEYELIVFDPGFESWLISNPHSQHMYSNEYLQNMNYQYVIAWNYLYSRGDPRVESYLDYDPTVKYNYDFNYKLFMYFKYFEETNRIKLIP
ncbi:MAG TPA: DUF6146 family protein [Bacteroidales bacterium]|nr:DUF6146 family protein [Bacteroidales bacterium]